MKWMNWSWEDLQSAPPEIVSEIVDMINEEEAERELDDIKNG